MTPYQYEEAARLHAEGFRLCELYPMSKRPVGDGWNNRQVSSVSESAGGYGLILAANGLCSIDFDTLDRAEAGLRRCGFDAQAIRDAGVHTTSTRPGSGGRVTFRVPTGAALRWLKFSSREKGIGTILELRATSLNLQDSLPGTRYHSADGSGPWVQDYAGFLTLDMAPDLPADLLQWWEAMSRDVEYLRAQQSLFVGPNAQLSVSSGDGSLAYSSAYRAEFNMAHRVEDLLAAHDYVQARSGRWAPPTATGAAAVRPIPGRDDLWQSDHASDPLHGTFDAWTAFVVLEHGGEQSAAEGVLAEENAVSAVDGFEDEPVRLTRRQEPVWPAVAEFDSPGTFQCSGDLGTNAGSLVIVRDEIDLFEDEPQTPQVRELEPEEDLPAFERDKTGRIKAIIGNLTKAVGRPDIVGVQIGQDGFRDEIMVAAPGTNQWRPLGDADYVWLRERLETGANGFCPISKEMIRDVVQAVAEKNKFDSAELWLNNLPYDGGSRCETFLRDYFGVEDTPYTRAVSLYMWTAMAGRVMEPGCKADMVPILVGDQGLGKSTAIGALVPSPEFFAEVSFAEKDDDLSRKMRGKLVAEIGELRGLHTKELEAIKAFVTRTHEQWIPKYREFGTTFPRRLIFIGSTNKDQFLADETGHRRWLPVRVSQVAVDKVREVAPLCWAEARRLFLAGGVQWKAAQELAKEIHDEYAFSDDWEEHVRKWIVDPIFGDEVALPRAFVTTTDALVEALGFDKRQIGRREEMRMAAVFRALGWERKRIQVEGVQKWRYVPTSG